MSEQANIPTPDEQDDQARAAGLAVPEQTEEERASQQPQVLGSSGSERDSTADDDEDGPQLAQDGPA